MMKTVIMAGGFGTRISSLFPNTPKSMIPIGGVPVLERAINCLKKYGFDDIIITVSYLKDKIIDYFGDGSKFGVHIEYFIEEIPLGNAGALFEIKEKLSDNFLLVNADSVFDIDLAKFQNYHLKNKALATIFTHPNSHPYDSGLIVCDKNKYAIEWLAKEDKRPKYYSNRVNAGIHILNKALLVNRPNKEKVDLDRDILKPLCRTKELICYDSPEYISDMGTPDRYVKVSKDFENRIPELKNLSNKQKAIFLDRDGTINKLKGFLKNIEDFELIDGTCETIKKINESNFLVIIITNQPQVARGELTFDEVDNIHKKLETLLGNGGAYVNAIYYCPHHPDKGFEGERPELKIDCDCRNPKPGLLLKAAKEFNIDLNQSFMIGDSDNDVKAGLAAGCKSYKIESDKGIECIVNKILEA